MNIKHLPPIAPIALSKFSLKILCKCNKEQVHEFSIQIPNKIEFNWISAAFRKNIFDIEMSSLPFLNWSYANRCLLWNTNQMFNTNLIDGCTSKKYWQLHYIYGNIPFFLIFQGTTKSWRLEWTLVKWNRWHNYFFWTVLVRIIVIN